MPSLSPEDQETLWSLVDYSTMSSAPRMAQVYQSDLFPIVDSSLQPWFDLFGTHGLAVAQGTDMHTISPTLPY